MHPVAKQLATSADNFMYASEPLGMLLWFGDVETARAGFAKVLDAHKRILTHVRQDEATADGCVQATHAFLPQLLCRRLRPRTWRRYVEIPSDNCVFNTKPHMKATEITDAGLAGLSKTEPQTNRTPSR